MNTYNVVVSVSTTVCIDAKDGNDAIDKVNQQLSHGDAALKAQLRETLKSFWMNAASKQPTLSRWVIEEES